jgi:AraC family transcriptional regulator of adaptative response / methylphosphotriester-DNA alkyltransferase methyltransferase
MKESIRILDIEKWQAVISCDSNYDGIFFYGVKTTGIFCRPSCKSKTPLRGNVIFFDNIANALEIGLRPCKRCCPDKVVFQPELELVKEAKGIFDVGYN